MLVSYTSDGARKKISVVTWALNDSRIVTAHHDNTINIWDSATGVRLHTLKVHQDQVVVLETNPLDSRVVLSAGYDGKIILWNIETGTIIRRMPALFSRPLSPRQ